MILWPQSPEQNVAIERHHQMIANGIRSILDERGLDQSF